MLERSLSQETQARLGETAAPEGQLWVAQNRDTGEMFSMGRPGGTQPPQKSLVPNAGVGPVQAGFPQHTPEWAGPPELTWSFLPLLFVPTSLNISMANTESRNRPRNLQLRSPELEARGPGL